MRIRLEGLGLLRRGAAASSSRRTRLDPFFAENVKCQLNETIAVGPNRSGGVFETRDFYLACFLRCSGYELLSLREKAAEGVRLSGSIRAARRRAGLLRRRDERPSLAFAATIKDMKGLLHNG